MSENLKYFLLICGLSSLLLIGSILSVNAIERPELVESIVYGYLVSLANVLFAFFSMKWAFKQSNTTFFAVILGGMGVRFSVLLAALFFVWKFVQIPFVAFIVSMVGFYLTLQIFEILFIQKALNNRKATL
ncbi:MAG: hypothetical protein O7G31_16525 [Calditrichaeota bacterium]|nr:hypothetical protein [Calditrichota bacterium]